MSRIAHRGGHTKASTGASALLDELTEDRNLIRTVVSLLAQYNEMVNCQPCEQTAYPSELGYGITIANNNNADLFFSIHLNKAYNAYDGALGSEVLVYPGDKLSSEIGSKVLDNLSRLGFKNRGLKDGRGLGEIDSIKCSSMIIEVCFVEASKDVEVYNLLGIDRIAHAIANGIDARVPLEPQEVTPYPAPIETPTPSIVYSAHLQDIGWTQTSKDGEDLGTVGQERRLEALSVSYFGPGNLKFQGHIQNYGWTNRRFNGEIIGTSGIGLRLEAVKIWIEDSDAYNVQYQVHIQNKGWSEWVENGVEAGTTGEGLRLEAIRIRIVSRR